MKVTIEFETPREASRAMLAEQYEDTLRTLAQEIRGYLRMLDRPDSGASQAEVLRLNGWARKIASVGVVPEGGK